MRATVVGVGTTLLIIAAATCLVPPAAAEPFLDLYTGKSFTRRSDIRITQPAFGNNFTFENVSFDDESFKTSPYYGLRAGYFFESVPAVGLALEFFHFKLLGETAETRHLIGTRSGAPVDAAVRVDSIVQQFNISHGLNYLTLDLLLRHRLLSDGERFRQGRVQLYGGVGVGPVIAHAENRIDGAPNEQRYEVAGAGVQVFLGARGLLFKYFGLFAEYKFTHSSLEVSVASGEGHVEENTHHLVGGITIPLPWF